MNPNLALMAAQQQGRLLDARASRLLRDTAPTSHHRRAGADRLIGRRARSAQPDRRQA